MPPATFLFLITTAPVTLPPFRNLIASNLLKAHGRQGILRESARMGCLPQTIQQHGGPSESVRAVR